MTQELHNEIVRRYHEGASIRHIARSLGISRHQVGCILKLHQRQRAAGVSQLPPVPAKRSSCLDDFDSALQQLLRRYPNITAVRMHEELKKQDFRGGYGIVKRRLRELRGAARPEFVQRFETGPGRQAQMDYSSYTIDFVQEGRRRVHAFSYVLGYSRRQYLRFVESLDFTTTVREHVRAFEYFGGVAATCLYDNMKVVVTDYDGDEPVYNTRFLGFATHYGYRPIACRPRRGQTKGKVERPFYYVETNLLNGRTFQSLEHLNDTAATWLKHTADVRVHRETKQRPIDRYQEEAAHLIALPAQPYDTAEVVYRCVNAEGWIAYGQNHYSVPWRHIGLRLPVRITETEVIVYGPDLEEIARHRLLAREVRGQTSQLDEHRPSDDAEQKYAVLKTRFEELGASAALFFERLLQRRRNGKSEAHKILALLEIYHRRDLLAAMDRAIRYGAYSRSAIERILAITATAKNTLDRLADKEQQQLRDVLGGDAVQPRSGQEYQHELFPGERTETDGNDTINDSDGDEAGPAPEDPETP